MTNLKSKMIDEILESGAKYVKTSISSESCAVSIAVADIECVDYLPDNFEWSKCSVGLDEEDY